MDLTLSTLLWAIPVFFVTGFVIGKLMKVLMPTYERSVLQLVGLVMFALLALVIVLVLMGVVNEYGGDSSTDVTVRRPRSFATVLLAPFGLGVLIGRLRSGRARMSRRQRVAKPAGTHDVPASSQSAETTVAPAQSVPDRPLPTPFTPGGLDPTVRHEAAEPGSPLPPPHQSGPTTGST